MAYEAVPDDVEIQKLTSAQRDALSRYKIHENINTFLGNENVPVVIGGLIAGVFAVNVAEGIIEDLENTVGPIAEKTKSAVRETVEIRLSRPTMIYEAIAKAIGSFELPKDLKIGGRGLA
jgi:hypothetical protein